VNPRITQPSGAPAATFGNGATPGATPGATGPGTKAGHGFTTLADVAAAAGNAGTAGLPRPRRLGGMVVLLVVFLVGTALLLGMRKLGMTRRIEMVDFKIDYPIEKAELDKLNKDHEDVLRELNSSGQLVQVPLDQVQTNPFQWKLTEQSVQPGTSDAGLEAELARKALEARKRQADSRFAMLRLNSVMEGRVPVAQISGTLVKIGDVLDDLFTVTAIEGRSVTLDAEGTAYRLSLGEGKEPRRSPADR